MKQLNLNVTAEFERDLRRLMRVRKVGNKSEAIRIAVREAVGRGGDGEGYDFREWLGAGLKAPLRQNRRFQSEDDLWL